MRHTHISRQQRILHPNLFSVALSLITTVFSYTQNNTAIIVLFGMRFYFNLVQLGIVAAVAAGFVPLLVGTLPWLLPLLP